MKINNQKFLKQLPYIFLIITIFAHNEVICNKNLKSSNTLNSKGDPNATPPSSSTTTATSTSTAQTNGFDVRTAVYVVAEVLKKVKTPGKENKDLYEKCIELTVKVDADSSLKKLWDYFLKVDYNNKENIKKDPINTFIEEAMTETNLEIDEKKGETMTRVKVNCAKSCKENSIGEINEFVQGELRDLLRPYFQPATPDVKSKNIITAFIGTYRNTDTARRLIPRLNLFK